MPQLAPELLLKIHQHMLMARLLEERLIRMQKQGDAYFWIGGPGEEAFSVPLGLLVQKGAGLAHDYLHLHYRAAGTLLAMGVDPVDSIRQMKCTATDPYSGGRNFPHHYAILEWNVLPVSSPIETQFSMAPGTALAQKRFGGTGITIVQGGDAGTAEADFPTCLVWSSRPGHELPILILVMNNQWGISTAAGTQHGERHIADRATPFGIKNMIIDGNDPESSYHGIQQAMDYVRTERRPFLLEVMVSRLYGHSSSSGANYVENELDCLSAFERTLEARGLSTAAKLRELRDRYTQELSDAAARVRDEPAPEPRAAFDHVFATENRVGSLPGGVR
ncbi:MAG TPA: thiamine pyrophosphate-dependent dehydrogenase E1 component subunit alpha [Kofleriaceae bacterium]|nr:thiamine pyrophosphate-dependent dehydrogenase E1 component subunit alpha [Kofleriaceae bacterium]